MPSQFYAFLVAHEAERLQHLHSRKLLAHFLLNLVESLFVARSEFYELRLSGWMRPSSPPPQPRALQVCSPLPSPLRSTTLGTWSSGRRKPSLQSNLPSFTTSMC